MRALEMLATEPRWVAWRNEDRGGKPTKVPYSPRAGMAKADDPATWGTRAAAEGRAASLVNGKDSSGVGIQLGDLGNDVFLGGIDLDACIDADSCLAPWAETLLAELDTYTERSPSGTGIKAFFFCASEDVRTFLEMLGVTNPEQWGIKRSVGANGRDHGPGVELYLARRYFAVTENLWPGKPDHIAMLDRADFERLAGRIPAPPRTTSPGHDNSRSAIAFRKGIALCRQGASFDQFCEALRSDPLTADWYLSKGLAGGMRELKRIWEKVGGSGEASGSDRTEIDRLGRLSPIEYERERHSAAERLGVRISILDKVVKSEREATTPRGRDLVFGDIEPWPEAIDRAALLDEMSAALRCYVVMREAEADVVSLWATAVHAFQAWIIFPRLFVTAPEKQCGKTTLLDAVSRLVPKPLIVSNVTAAALFRVIEAARPSLFLDEADGYVREDEALRSVINAGHRCDGAVIRTVGDDHDPRVFSVWAPMAIAAIGRLPGTIEDRAITIRLRRRKPNEHIVSLRLDRASPLDDFARKAARSVKDEVLAVFAEADPEMPAGLVNRAADNWRPLLAVADIAGGTWPQRARKAACEISGERNEDSARLTLLEDLRALFDAEPSSVLFTSEVLPALAERVDRPWPEWKNAKPISARQLGALLKGFEIPTNQTVRRGTRTDKGYRREDFDDAFARYLPVNR